MCRVRKYARVSPSPKWVERPPMLPRRRPDPRRACHLLPWRRPRAALRHSSHRCAGSCNLVLHNSLMHRHQCWRRGSEWDKNSRFFQNPLLCHYHHTTKDEPLYNLRTPIESGIFHVCQALDVTHPIPINYSPITQSSPIHWHSHWHQNRH